MALRVGGEPEREIFMRAREGLEEEVRVLLGRGRRNAVAHLVELAFELLLIPPQRRPLGWQRMRRDGAGRTPPLSEMLP